MGSSSCLLRPNNSPIKGVAVRAVIIPLVDRPPERPLVASFKKKFFNPSLFNKPLALPNKLP